MVRLWNSRDVDDLISILSLVEDITSIYLINSDKFEPVFLFTAFILRDLSQDLTDWSFKESKKLRLCMTLVLEISQAVIFCYFCSWATEALKFFIVMGLVQCCLLFVNFRQESREEENNQWGRQMEMKFGSWSFYLYRRFFLGLSGFPFLFFSKTSPFRTIWFDVVLAINLWSITEIFHILQFIVSEARRRKFKRLQHPSKKSGLVATTCRNLISYVLTLGYVSIGLLLGAGNFILYLSMSADYKSQATNDYEEGVILVYFILAPIVILGTYVVVIRYWGTLLEIANPKSLPELLQDLSDKDRNEYLQGSKTCLSNCKLGFCNCICLPSLLLVCCPVFTATSCIVGPCGSLVHKKEQITEKTDQQMIAPSVSFLP